MTRVLRGVIHGKTIQLDENTGLDDGRQVEVILRVRGLPGPPAGWQPGSTETAAGMMADGWTEEEDRIQEEIQQDRRKDSRRELPE
jgi:hypothetical protein